MAFHSAPTGLEIVFWRLSQDCPFALLRVVLGYFPLPLRGACVDWYRDGLNRNHPRSQNRDRGTPRTAAGFQDDSSANWTTAPRQRSSPRFGYAQGWLSARMKNASLYEQGFSGRFTAPLRGWRSFLGGFPRTAPSRCSGLSWAIFRCPYGALAGAACTLQAYRILELVSTENMHSSGFFQGEATFHALKKSISIPRML